MLFHLRMKKRGVKILQSMTMFDGATDRLLICILYMQVNLFFLIFLALFFARTVEHYPFF